MSAPSKKANGTKSKDIKAVAAALLDSEAVLIGARKRLANMITAHLLMAGDESLPVGAEAESRLMTYAEDASSVVAHIECLDDYFATIRTALGIVEESDGAKAEVQP